MEIYELNKKKIVYTLKHRIAFLKCVEVFCPQEYKQELLKRAKYHDMDKVVLNCLCDSELASKLHKNCLHHKTKPNDKTNVIDCLEMIFDWECARYTKPDKPRNAYLTLFDFYPEIKDKILPLLKVLNLDSPENKNSKEVFDAVNSYELNDEKIKSEIASYIADYENSNDKYKEVEDAIVVYQKLLIKENKTHSSIKKSENNRKI